MTSISIQEQIETIKKATEKAVRSKQSAIKFLRDAGIIDDRKLSSKTAKKQK